MDRLKELTLFQVVACSLLAANLMAAVVCCALLSRINEKLYPIWTAANYPPNYTREAENLLAQTTKHLDRITAQLEVTNSTLSEIRFRH
jgi:hypothetical protein